MADLSLSDQWRSRLDECASSGLGVEQWCDSHNLPVHRFYYWRRKFAKARNESVPNRVDWLPVCPDPEPGLTVRVGAASIDVGPGFSPDLLRSVVAALGVR